MSLPDFICIGAQKAGTTWLHQMLAQNPSVWLPPLKELHFLSHAANPRNKEHPSDPDTWGVKFINKGISRRLKELKRKDGPVDAGYVDYLNSLIGPDIMTEAWYRRIFSYPAAEGKVKCEITPAYLAIDAEGIAYAKSLLGDVKLLLIVREPVSRLVSQVKMGVVRSGEEEYTDEVWENAIENAGKRRRGDYADAIPLWQEHFGDRLLILPFGDIKTKPGEFIRRVEDFMDIPHFDRYQMLNEQVHKTKDVAVPGWVGEKIGALMKPQQDFIRQHFGQEFYERTR